MVDSICIDATNRPFEIPESHWVKLHERYTITRIARMAKQSNILGCQLAEIDLFDFPPYEFFRLDRFGINIQDIEKLKELIDMKNETDEIYRLLEEQIEELV